MTSEAPPFWWKRADWRAYALAPFAALYGSVAARRMATAPRRRTELPVLCVGNFTVGGTGKTPVAIALARQAIAMGLRPGILSRGHGGSSARPHIVAPHADTARHVGDEPLLLAEVAPVAVTPNRAAGAKLLTERGSDFLIMDDGFQSAQIHIDYALLVVDSHRGLGNGFVIPAGPLRAPVVEQLRFADAILRVGSGAATDGVVRLAARANKPVFEAFLRPRNPQDVAGRRWLAFSGIGNPRKFFETAIAAGAELAATRSFPDHHLFSLEEMDDLEKLAAREGVGLLTTAKDAARMRNGPPTSLAFLDKLTVLEIDAVFEIDNVPQRIVSDTLEAWRKPR